jgi:antitoxin (DNA-binding transcriptional repressor) of toxin-antitoxin stability system
MSKQDDARRIAAGLKYTVTTRRGQAVAEIVCPGPNDARRVLAAFGREGWKTTMEGKTVRAEVSL